MSEKYAEKGLLMFLTEDEVLIG